MPTCPTSPVPKQSFVPRGYDTGPQGLFEPLMHHFLATDMRGSAAPLIVSYHNWWELDEESKPVYADARPTNFAVYSNVFLGLLNFDDDVPRPHLTPNSKLKGINNAGFQISMTYAVNAS